MKLYSRVHHGESYQQRSTHTSQDHIFLQLVYGISTLPTPWPVVHRYEPGPVTLCIQFGLEQLFYLGHPETSGALEPRQFYYCSVSSHSHINFLLTTKWKTWTFRIVYTFSPLSSSPFEISEHGFLEQERKEVVTTQKDSERWWACEYWWILFLVWRHFLLWLLSIWSMPLT